MLFNEISKIDPDNLKLENAKLYFEAYHSSQNVSITKQLIQNVPNLLPTVASVIKFLELVVSSELAHCDDAPVKMAIQKAFKLGVTNSSQLRELTLTLLKSMSSKELVLPFLDSLSLQDLEHFVPSLFQTEFILKPSETGEQPSTCFHVTIDQVIDQLLPKSEDTSVQESILLSIYSLKVPLSDSDTLQKQIDLTMKLLTKHNQDKLLLKVFNTLIDRKTWHCKLLVWFCFRLIQKNKVEYFEAVYEMMEAIIHKGMCSDLHSSEDHEEHWSAVQVGLMSIFTHSWSTPDESRKMLGLFDLLSKSIREEMLAKFDKLQLLVQRR